MIIQKQRKAFSMITALFVIVLMSAVAAYILSISGKIVKQTTTQYQKEQAILLAKSYTEYAILAVMANDRNATGNDCLEDINGRIGTPVNGEGYQVRVRIAYLGDDSFGSCSSTRVLSNTVTNSESKLNIIVDAYVQYRDLDHPKIGINNNEVPWTIYHRRTLQKI